MKLCEYQKKAVSTAIYPEEYRIIYPALGLIGECGEVAEKIKKLIRDDNANLTDDRKKAIAKELGDCCWYLASICHDTNHDLSMVHKMRGADILHQIRDLTLPRLVLHMHRHAVVATTALEDWHYIRNGHASYRGHYTKLPASMSHIITCVEEIAGRCGFTLEDICTMNIDKLESRRKRGTLKGDGDDR